MNITKIGKRIRAARELRGLTQADVSEHLNMTPDAISKIELGQSTLTLKNLEKLPEILDQPVTYFLGLEIPNVTENEIELLTLFRALSPEAQDLALKTLQSWQKKAAPARIPLSKIIRSEITAGDADLLNWVEQATPDNREELANLLKMTFGLGDIA